MIKAEGQEDADGGGGEVGGGLGPPALCQFRVCGNAVIAM